MAKKANKNSARCNRNATSSSADAAGAPKDAKGCYKMIKDHSEFLGGKQNVHQRQAARFARFNTLVKNKGGKQDNFKTDSSEMETHIGTANSTTCSGKTPITNKSVKEFIESFKGCHGDTMKAKCKPNTTDDTVKEIETCLTAAKAYSKEFKDGVTTPGNAATSKDADKICAATVYSALTTAKTDVETKCKSLEGHLKTMLASKKNCIAAFQECNMYKRESAQVIELCRSANTSRSSKCPSGGGAGGNSTTGGNSTKPGGNGTSGNSSNPGGAATTAKPGANTTAAGATTAKPGANTTAAASGNTTAAAAGNATTAATNGTAGNNTAGATTVAPAAGNTTVAAAGNTTAAAAGNTTAAAGGSTTTAAAGSSSSTASTSTASTSTAASGGRWW